MTHTNKSIHQELALILKSIVITVLISSVTQITESSMHFIKDDIAGKQET